MAISGSSGVSYSNGQIITSCQTTSYAPTNPKTGSSTRGNTVVWNSQSGVSTLVKKQQTDEFIWSSPTYSSVPRTSENATYRNTMSGRVAPTALTPSKTVVAVSRYSNDSKTISCDPKPTFPQCPTNTISTFKPLCQYPKIYSTTSTSPFCQ